MIEKVITFGRSTIRELIESSARLDISEGWALISIHKNIKNPTIKNDNDSNILKEKGCEKILIECFGDYTDQDYIKFSEKYKTVSKHINLIRKTQAYSIVRFLKFLKKCDNIKTLVTQCDAGISRSGAIGLYACRFFGLNENEYVKSRVMHPNYYVYKKLSEIYNPVSLLQEGEI